MEEQAGYRQRVIAFSPLPVIMRHPCRRSGDLAWDQLLPFPMTHRRVGADPGCRIGGNPEPGSASPPRASLSPRGGIG